MRSVISAPITLALVPEIDPACTAEIRDFSFPPPGRIPARERGRLRQALTSDALSGMPIPVVETANDFLGPRCQNVNTVTVAAFLCGSAMSQLWYFLPPLAGEFGLSWFSRSAINSRTRVLSCLCHGANMIPVITCFKYLAAVILFIVGTLAGAILVNICVRIANHDAQGIWVYVVPYFAALMAGIASAYAGLYMVDRFIPTVRLRTVVWVFIGLQALVWSPALVGLLLAVWGVMDAPLHSHSLGSGRDVPALVQSFVAAIGVFKMTAPGGTFERS